MESDLQYWFLQNHDLLSLVNKADIKQLSTIANFSSLKKEDIIYSHKQQIDKIYFLNHGRIKIAYCIQKGIEVVSEILKDGDLFGELSFKKSENIHCEFSQVLSDEAKICAFSLTDFEIAIRKNTDLNIGFSKMVAQKLKTISGKYCDLVFKDARARVLNFFILHAQYEGKWTGNKAEINMYCTHQDIANFTASSRPTVSTIINHLVKEKKLFTREEAK